MMTIFPNGALRVFFLLIVSAIQNSFALEPSATPIPLPSPDVKVECPIAKPIPFPSLQRIVESDCAKCKFCYNLNPKPGDMHADCDDFAACLAALLNMSGIPAEVLYLYKCDAFGGGSHAMTLVQISEPIPPGKKVCYALIETTQCAANGDPKRRIAKNYCGEDHADVLRQIGGDYKCKGTDQLPPVHVLPPGVVHQCDDEPLLYMCGANGTKICDKKVNVCKNLCAQNGKFSMETEKYQCQVKYRCEAAPNDKAWISCNYDQVIKNHYWPAGRTVEVPGTNPSANVCASCNSIAEYYFSQSARTDDGQASCLKGYEEWKREKLSDKNCREMKGPSITATPRLDCEATGDKTSCASAAGPLFGVLKKVEEAVPENEGPMCLPKAAVEEIIPVSTSPN